MSRRWVAAGLVLPLLTAVACSDGDETLTKEEYIAAGDALCQRFMDATSDQTDPQSAEEMAALLDELIPLAEEISADLAALDPPSEAEAVHDTLRSALDGSTAKVKEARQALEDGDVDAFATAMDEAIDIGDDSDQPAKDFGFEVCGSEAELRAE